MQRPAVLLSVLGDGDEGAEYILRGSSGWRLGTMIVSINQSLHSTES